MSARVVAVTQLLIDVLEDLGPKDACKISPCEMELALLFIPLLPELKTLRDEARLEMGARVIEVIGT